MGVTVALLRLAKLTTNIMGNSNSAEDLLKEGAVITLRHGDSCIIEKELAKGGFSTVCACKRNSDGLYMAVKRVRTRGGDAEAEALTEIRIHHMLGDANPCSPFIAPLLGSKVEKVGDCRDIYLFFPLFRNGSLSDCLLNDDLVKDFLTEKTTLELFLSCAMAVETLHEHNIAHCDIKPLNFMLSEDRKSCILIDFGSARGPPLIKQINKPFDALSEQERAEKFCSAAYRAPELWDVPSKGYLLDFQRCDVFALGCVLYAMSFPPYGFSPFESPLQGIMPLAARTASFSFPSNQDNLSKNGDESSRNLPKFREVRGAKELISSMLSHDPAQRITAKEVVIRTKQLLDEIEEEDFAVDFSSSPEALKN